MKIRIKGNTVRYRLSKSEVTTLAKVGLLEEKTEFITATLCYAIRQIESNDLSADFTQHTITLYVPQAGLQQWANSSQVSMESNMLLPNGNSLYLLIEKDFKCIDADVSEDQSDYFENPHFTC